ncbi:MAG: hypothetical protein AAGH76_09500 [Pseudomonadota bacterium]
MKLRLIAAGFLALMTSIAQADEWAYEVEAGLIQLPGSISGSVIVRECDRCETFTHRVTASTRYRLNGAATSLERLSAAMPAARDSQGVFVVFYDIETRLVTAIALDL